MLVPVATTNGTLFEVTVFDIKNVFVYSSYCEVNILPFQKKKIVTRDLPSENLGRKSTTLKFSRGEPSCNNLEQMKDIFFKTCLFVRSYEMVLYIRTGLWFLYFVWNQVNQEM